MFTHTHTLTYAFNVITGGVEINKYKKKQREVEYQTADGWMKKK